MHLTEADIARYVENVLELADRRRFESHLADCAECVEAVAHLIRVGEMEEGLHELPEEVLRRAEELVPPHAHRPGRLKHRRTLWYGVAASLALAVGIGYYVATTHDGSGGQRFRSESPIPVSLLLSPPDNATVALAELEFAWAEIPGAIRYRFVLYRLDGTEVWSATTAHTKISLPEPIALQPEMKYLWRVEVLFPDDTRFRSQIHVFTPSP